MPWSLHFVFRGGPEKKGRKEKGPPARRKIPVARTPFRSACNSLSAHFRLERRCRIPPQQYRLRDAARRSFSCRRFLRRHRDFSNGRCHPAAHLRSGQQSTPSKIKGGSHHPPGPDAGPSTLTLTFPTHSDSRIREKTRLRTYSIHSSAPAPPVYLLSNTGAAPRPCRLRPVPAKREKNRPVASAVGLSERASFIVGYL